MHLQSLNPSPTQHQIKSALRSQWTVPTLLDAKHQLNVNAIKTLLLSSLANVFVDSAFSQTHIREVSMSLVSVFSVTGFGRGLSELGRKSKKESWTKHPQGLKPFFKLLFLFVFLKVLLQALNATACATVSPVPSPAVHCLPLSRFLLTKSCSRHFDGESTISIHPSIRPFWMLHHSWYALERPSTFQCSFTLV